MLSLDPVGAAAALLAFGLYLNTLNADFVYDDARAILQNGDLLSETPLWNLLSNDFWGTPLSHSGSHKSYRPLCTLSFRLNRLFSFGDGQPSAAAFHLVNVLLHCLVTYLFASVLNALKPRLKISERCRCLAALCFAAHPVHAEAVAGVVGRADVLAAAFFLSAVIAYTKCVDVEEGRNVENEEQSGAGGGERRDKNGNVPEKKAGKGCCARNSDEDDEDHVKSRRFPSKTWLGATVALTACAMLSKEQGVTAVAVCFAADAVGILNNTPKKNSSRLLLLTASAAALLAVRAKAMGFAPPKFAKADNPAAAADSFLTRTLTFAHLPVLNLWLLLCPNKLSFDWSMDAVPLITSFFDSRNLMSLIFYAVLAKTLLDCLKMKMTKKSGDPAVCFSFILMVLPFLPATNLFFYVGFVLAERVLYIPSLGFCLLLAYSVDKTLRRFSKRWFFILSAIMILLPMSLRTVLRNADWSDEGRLYLSGARINPPKAYGNLANVLTQRGQLADAEVALKLALAHRPNMADSHYNLGVLYQKQNRLQEAVRAYETAIHFRPKLVLAHLNLGLTLSSLGRKEEALSVQTRASSIGDDGLKDPRSHAVAVLSAKLNAGKLLLEMGRAREALETLSDAEKESRTKPHLRFPSQQVLMNLLGEACQALNLTEAAERWYSLAAERQHVPAYLKYGKLLARNKTRHVEAEEQFSKALRQSPSDPSVRLHYGLFLMDAGRNLEAARSFEAAAELINNGRGDGESHYEVVFNAAVAFRLAGGHDHKAEHFYRRAVDIRPEDASSHMNLGAMLHLLGKDLAEAEEHYLAALRLDPANEAARTNLQRLRNTIKAKSRNP